MNALNLWEDMDKMEFTETESDMSEGSNLFPHFIFNFIVIITIIWDQFDYYLIYINKIIL